MSTSAYLLQNIPKYPVNSNMIALTVYCKEDKSFYLGIVDVL